MDIAGRVGTLIRTTFQALMNLLPWIGRILSWMTAMAAAAIATVWVGIPSGIQRTTDHFMRRASLSGDG